MCNVGAIDKVIRFFVGVVLIIAAFFVGSLVSTLAGIIVGVVGGVVMATGVFGICLAYLPFGINTCK